LDAKDSPEFSPSELKTSLSLLHSFNIVHFDIKPDNLMFSRAHNKNVFIDFGLSEIVDAKLGQKCVMNYRGTLDYCST